MLNTVDPLASVSNYYLLCTVPTYSLYTVALVMELLEYCDEYEDESQEAGGSDTEMEEGERGTTSIAIA